MTKQVIGADVFDMDISQIQLDSAIELFPELSGSLEVGDVTRPLSQKGDLVYVNAVTMHLGSPRMKQALSNMVEAAGKVVLLIKTWSVHDYSAYCENNGLDFEWFNEFGVKGLLIRSDSERKN